MGQYYVAVNLDRKEYLNPHAFGDGAKLLEFGSDSYGMMTALAMLLADGNGRGGGDIQRTYYANDKKQGGWRARKGERVEWQNISDSFLGDGTKNYGKGFVPEVAGTWAGDRIVITGDYADAGKFLDEDITPDAEGNVPNLYAFLHDDESGFTDISEAVKDGMRTNEWLSSKLDTKRNYMVG